jgi:Mg-chelatase subunit ChlD
MSASLLAAQHSAAFFVLGLLQGTDIKVRFGDGPMFDRTNRVIWFPDYLTLVDQDSNADLQRSLLFVYQAMAMHEHEHPLFTTDDRCSGKVPFHLWMSLEDVRVDILGQSRYPGGKLIFERGYGALIDTGRYWTAPSASDGIVRVTTAWTLFRARHMIAGQQCFAALADTAHKALVSLVGDAEVGEAWSIVSRTKAARSSAEVVKIVNKLLIWLKRQLDNQQQQPQQPQPQQQQSQDQDQDDSDDSSQASQTQADADDSSPADDSDSSTSQGASSSPQDDSDSQDPSDASSDDSTQSSDDSSGNQATSGEGASDPSDDTDTSASTSGEDDATDSPMGSPSSGHSDDAPALAPADLASIDDGADDLPQDVGSALSEAFNKASQVATKIGAVASYVPQVASSPTSSGSYTGDRDTRPLSIRLTRLLSAQSRDYVTYDRRGSRIDTQKLARWHLGEREVFYEENTVRRVDTAVMIVVDRSASMRDRIQVARSAALRLSLALADVPGTSVSAIAFPDAIAGGTYQDVRRLLPFGAPVRSHARAFLELDAPTYAGTPLCIALTHARYELLRQNKPRRICLVLTDGEPDGGSDSVRPHIELMLKDRIEVIGVGIKTMSVEDLFPRHEVIQDLGDLEPALFTLLQSVLLRKRAA